MSHQTYTKRMGGGDFVAWWDVRLSDGVHRIGFEHGTTTGKRIICIDGKETIRRDWMFRLVGMESFEIGDAKCVIKIEPVGGFSYEYSLEINGKSYKKFRESQSKILTTWLLQLEDEVTRVVLEKDTLDVWVNGDRLDTTGEFVDDGTETHFEMKGRPAYIKAVSSGSRREGIIHSLIIDGVQVPEAIE